MNLIESIKCDSIRVHAPTSVVFLCGGVVDPSAVQPIRLRDAFFRIAKTAAPNYQIVLAEDAQPLTTDAGYNNLFSFESDVAQIVGLILLFVESPGSVAELGAFAALNSVAPSLLAVVEDTYYEQVSFIKNGPIRYLENEYGEEWILVLDREEVGIAPDGTIADLDLSSFATAVFPTVEKRLADRPAWSKFDPANSGHCILLMTGLCQEFGALTLTEIKQLMAHVGIEQPRLANYLYCAELLGWLKRIRKGHHIYYAARPAENAISFSFVETALYRDKVRWRADIRIHWKANDAPRWRAISEMASGS